MHQLKLPSFDHKLQVQDGKTYIFDIIRKKYVLLTPEEWVRQHFIHLLLNHYFYPKSLFKIESGHKYNNLSKRTDILAYDREGKPYLLVECKSPEVKISKDIFRQISIYNATVKSKYIVVTNGLIHFCCMLKEDGSGYEYLNDVPFFMA